MFLLWLLFLLLVFLLRLFYYYFYYRYHDYYSYYDDYYLILVLSIIVLLTLVLHLEPLPSGSKRRLERFGLILVLLQLGRIHIAGMSAKTNYLYSRCRFFAISTISIHISIISCFHISITVIFVGQKKFARLLNILKRYAKCSGV